MYPQPHLMSRNTLLRQRRDEALKERFRHHRKKNPKWRIDAIIEEVAGEFYLSCVTVTKILKGQNESHIPDPSTISRRLNQPNPCNN